MSQRQRPRAIQLVIEREVSLFDIEAAIQTSGIDLKHLVVKQGETPEVQRVEVILEGAGQKDLMPLLEKLRLVEGIREVSANS